MKTSKALKECLSARRIIWSFSLVWHNLMASGPTMRLLVIAATYGQALMHERCRIFTDLKAGS